jgi:SAM-dependent methyltransferase
MDGLDQFKAAQREAWVHFAPLQIQTMEPAARLVKWAGIAAGQRVLDVACGTGVVAITAARLGAEVIGLDLTPALLDAARENARAAGVAVTWQEGDAEVLPFPDASFDVVVSQYGHIFAPRPDVAAAEMLRVLRPGGTIAFSTWPPELLVGRTFALTARYMPPPATEVPSPTLWGEPQVIRQRLGDRVRNVTFTRATMNVPALGPRHAREVREKTAGPTVKLVQMLEATDPAKLAVFRKEMEDLITEYFDGNVVTQGYLITRAIKN